MPTVRFRIDLAPHCSIGPGKIELLETIAESGSIRRAASQMHMSYRRAWLLVDSLNRSFSEAVTTASTGGAGGGGVRLTEFGAELVRRYRSAAERIEKLAQAEFAPLANRIAARPPSPGVAGRKRLSKPTRKS
ncbi:MAG TPA: LysR family transcriptional regulator [Steroidobacteraceae bacterium]|nr:LysR family transcriptional regulator [Steroidobacteraceae bacterium]